MTEKPPRLPGSGPLPGCAADSPLFDAVLFPKMVLPLMVMQGEWVKWSTRP